MHIVGGSLLNFFSGVKDSQRDFRLTLIVKYKYINQMFCVKQKAQGDAAQNGTAGEITQTIVHRKHSIMNKICLELFIFGALFYPLYLARPGNCSWWELFECLSLKLKQHINVFCIAQR